MPNKYFTREPLPKVGSVIHRLNGAGAQQYVKAEVFDTVVDERNTLQALVEWQEQEISRLVWQMVAAFGIAGAALIGLFWSIWQ